jgi:hypothetical protein
MRAPGCCRVQGHGPRARGGWWWRHTATCGRELAPLHPQLMLHVTLLDSDRLARPLAALNASAHHWDPAVPLVANLERLSADATASRWRAVAVAAIGGELSALLCALASIHTVHFFRFGFYAG